MPVMSDVTMTAFEEGRGALRTVILPCGALEEHGSHLPLGTDTLHAEELARAVALARPVWVAPAIPYGVCRSSSGHPGTVGISLATLSALVKDVLRSLYAQEMRNFVVLTGHAGGTHGAALVNACEELLAELPEARFAVLSVLDVGKAAWGGLVETPRDSHAGEVETSLVMYLRPALVFGTSPEEYPAFPAHVICREKRRFWPGGVWGNPAAASAGKGAALMERSVAYLCGLIDELERGE